MLEGPAVGFDNVLSCRAYFMSKMQTCTVTLWQTLPALRWLKASGLRAITF